MSKKKTGTREWSSHSYNCVSGCVHACRYCYARASALRFGRIENANQWGRETVRWKDVWRKHPKYDGVVMFPTTHDITHGNVEACSEALQNLLDAGNDVLVVSKPDPLCVAQLRRDLENFKKQVEFRFTIGSRDNADLSFWEPGAPDFGARKKALEQTFKDGWKTSVSAEPLLAPWDIKGLWDSLIPYVTETFWIGKLNKPKSRCVIDTHEMAWLNHVLMWQEDDRVMLIYEQFRKEPKVRWKDSYREVINSCG